MREWLYRKRWRRRRVETREQALRSIRDHYRALGVPVDHLTDEELEAAVLRFSRAVARAGVTTAQAANGLRQLARAFPH